MPKKSADDRIRRAKAAGHTATIKADDPGVQPRETLSSHAAKKSRWNIGEGFPEGRSVGHNAPPHTGTMRNPPVEGEPESVMPADRRAALPREEREAEQIRMGHRDDKLSPGRKKRGQF